MVISKNQYKGGLFIKITEKLKGRLQSAKSADEVQTILKEVKKGTEEAGVILSDDDLDQASGGAAVIYYGRENTRR